MVDADQQQSNIALVVRLVGDISLMLVPILTGLALNTLNEPEIRTEDLLILVGIAVATGIVFLVTAWYSERKSADLATQGLASLQRALFDHMQTLQGRPHRVQGRRLQLRRGAQDPAPQHLRGGAGRVHRHLRPDRCRQVDDHQHPHPLLRHRQRPDPHRWPGPGQADAGFPAEAGGRRAAGGFPLQRHGHEQPQVRPRGRDRRGVHRGRQAGQCARLHRQPAAGLRHDAHRPRVQPVTGPAADDHHRAGHRRRPQGP